MNLYTYITSEMFGIRINTGHVHDIDTIPIENLLSVAPALEKLLFFGFLVCVDAFLYLFTYFPLRVIIALISLYVYLHSLFLPFLLLPPFLTSDAFKLNQVRIFDLLRAVLLLIGYFALYYINLSNIYHLIRSQNTIKLYVLASMIEVIDKLLSSFGQDIFDVLLSKLRNSEIPILHFIIAGIYVVLHSFLYFFQVATLTVVINSEDDALLTVLILNNFTELKGYVFKKYDQNNLFQLSCSDIIERFQTIIFLFLVFLVTLLQGSFNWFEHGWNFLRTTFFILTAESIADSIKHCFICKFNSITSTVYRDYSFVLRRDLLSTGKDDVVVDHTFMVTRRIGLCQVCDIFFCYRFILVFAFFAFRCCLRGHCFHRFL
jgi:hypothetical protein